MELTPDLGASGALTADPDAGAGASCAPAREAPFTLIEPFRRTAPIIFASPHSGRRYPPDLLAQSRASLMSLRRSEDAYVDELFAPGAAHGATVLAASVARAYVDLNRDPAELDPDMFAERLSPESLSGSLSGSHSGSPSRPHSGPTSPRVQAGLGAIPRVTGDGQPIYWGKLSLAEAERRIGAVHRPYHQMLSGLIADTRAQFGCAILIDCHSMPVSARGAGAPDVVLGDRFGASCHPGVTALVEAALRRLGYRVARNAPFAGGHTTQLYGRPALRVHALQIEICRALYLDERSLERTSGFSRVRTDMSRLAEALAAAALHRSLA